VRDRAAEDPRLEPWYQRVVVAGEDQGRRTGPTVRRNPTVPVPTPRPRRHRHGHGHGHDHGARPPPRPRPDAACLPWTLLGAHAGKACGVPEPAHVVSPAVLGCGLVLVYQSAEDRRRRILPRTGSGRAVLRAWRASTQAGDRLTRPSRRFPRSCTTIRTTAARVEGCPFIPGRARRPRCCCRSFLTEATSTDRSGQ